MLQSQSHLHFLPSRLASNPSHPPILHIPGDLDFFELHGIVYPLDDIFFWLEKFLHRKVLS